MKEQMTSCPRPARDRTVLWVERLKGNDEQEFILASNELYGYYTHWIGARNVPCWKNHDFCEGGHTEASLRQNYVIRAHSQKRNKMVFLYLTPGAVIELEDKLGDEKEWKGIPLIVTRDSRNNGLLHVRVSVYRERQRISSKDLDPWESIMNFLKVPKHVRDQRRHLGTIPEELRVPA